MRRFILFAPNVGVGGGLVLLRAFLDAWPEDRPMVAILDERGRSVIEGDGHRMPVHWTRSSLGGRARAERLLAGMSTAGDVVFCFHNLPPMRPSPATVLCFLHNAYLVGLAPSSGLSSWVRIRSAVERLILKRFGHRIDSYVVQTPTMAEALRRMLGRYERPVHVLPFVDPRRMPGPSGSDVDGGRRFDFLYVSDGAAHKNHRNVFRAWELLAERGSFPTLAVTLHPVRDAALRAELDRLTAGAGVRIVDLGQMPHERLLRLYGDARAALFASSSESFGLPLIEAGAAGLPIVAAELDFVRDVCEPAVTFDPHSPRSIARAVSRFLGRPADRVAPLTPGAFAAAVAGLDHG